MKTIEPSTEIDFSAEVPVKSRIEVYEKAKEMLTNKVLLKDFGLDLDDGLCFLLPCIYHNCYWRLISWRWEETKYAFPEIEQEIEFINSSFDPINARLKSLDRMIENAKSLTQ